MVSMTCKMQTAEEGHPCIWMQAGVVRKKICRIGYDCPECHFDRILKHVADENRRMSEAGIIPKGRRGKIVSWQEKLCTRPTSKRPCIHHLKKRIHFRICRLEYRCGNCDFDQYFDDQYSVHTVVSPVSVLDVQGFRVPQGYYFHPGHTWVKIEEGSSLRVGIDDFALRLLGPLDRVNAPLLGKEVKQGRGDVELFRGSHRARVPSPVSGVVTAINPKLRDLGELANRDPYSEGWVMNVHAKNLRQDLKTLMINTETRHFMDGQVERLYQEIEEIAGPLSADGGHLGHDIYGSMPELGWERLTKIFLGD